MSWDILPKAILQYFLQKIKAIIPTKTSDLTNDSGYTNNIGTITGITMNGSSKGTSGVVDLGTVVTDVSGKADKSSTVSNVAYDTTNKKITKTINGTTSDVVAVSTLKSDMQLTKSDVGLENVGNFKAVSTSANQGLTDTEKSNARANIDTPSNGDIQSSKTLKSSVVTVTDAAPINAEDITVDITPKQDLHGYGRPWAGGAGKNKFNIDLLNTTNFSRNGQTITNKITDTRTSLALQIQKLKNNNVVSTIGNLVVDGTGAKFKIVNITADDFDALRFKHNGINTDIDILRMPWTATGIFVLSFNCEGYNPSVVGGLVLSNIQFEQGSTPTTFAPYSNICPIEGRTGAELDRVGKNLFDKSIFCVNAFLQSGIVYKQGTGTCLVFDTEDLIGQTITISCSYDNRYVLTGFDVDARTLIASDEIYSGTQISTTSWTTRTFSVEYKAYVYYISNNGFKEELGEGVQLELGSTATAYEPYQGQQYTASFGETVYGGKWHVTEGGTDNGFESVVFDGSNDEAWAKSSNAFYIALNELVKKVSYTTDQIKCDKLKTVSHFMSIVNGTELDSISAYSDTSYYVGQNWLYIGVSGVSTVEDLRTWLASNNIQVVYEKATPTTISTPKQNVPMLQGINTVSADCGDVSLKYQPDNVVGELKGEIEDNIIYEDYKWTTESSRSYSAGAPGTYGCSSWRNVAKEGYDVIGVTFVENRRFGDCILTLYYIPSTSHVEVIIFRATSSSVTIADDDITYRVAYKKH